MESLCKSTAKELIRAQRIAKRQGGLEVMDLGEHREFQSVAGRVMTCDDVPNSISSLCLSFSVCAFEEEAPCDNALWPFGIPTHSKPGTRSSHHRQQEQQLYFSSSMIESPARQLSVSFQILRGPVGVMGLRIQIVHSRNGSIS